MQDKQATKARQNMWQCGFCSKRFRTRGYLDAHFDRKHEHDADPVRLMCHVFVHGFHLTVLALQDAHDCFADLCPVVGCPNYNPSSDPHGLDRHALSFMCEVSQRISLCQSHWWSHGGVSLASVSLRRRCASASRRQLGQQ